MKPNDVADAMRKAMQIGYCMNYDKFCQIMYNGQEDYYTKEKWDLMQKDFSKWFCYLDSGNAAKYMRYVLS